MENQVAYAESSKLPKCFISYSWENQEHKDWVRHLAEELEKAWIDTLLDQWDVYPGLDFVMYMNTSIRESDFVVLVCTPTYAEKANAEPVRGSYIGGCR